MTCQPPVSSLCTSQPQYQVFQCERNISFPAVGFTEECQDRRKKFINVNLTSLEHPFFLLFFVLFRFGQTCKASSLTPKRITERVLMLLEADIKTQLCVAGPKTLKRQKGWPRQILTKTRNILSYDSLPLLELNKLAREIKSPDLVNIKRERMWALRIHGDHNCSVRCKTTNKKYGSNVHCGCKRREKEIKFSTRGYAKSCRTTQSLLK